MRANDKPKHAATVILLRAAHARGFEVLLTRRPDAMAFLGGMYCFPGGAVQKSDHADGILRRLRGLSGERARAIVGAQFAPAVALGFWITAVRELFEETGILLAVQENGEPIARNTPLGARLLEKHAALLAKSVGFQSVLEGENLFCDAAGLAYLSHWQTPPHVATRYDTRFFIAAMPEDQTELATSSEVSHSLWLTPDHALQRFQSGELPMAFPTFASLRTLADFDTLKSVLHEFQPRGS